MTVTDRLTCDCECGRLPLVDSNPFLRVLCTVFGIEMSKFVRSLATASAALSCRSRRGNAFQRALRCSLKKRRESVEKCNYTPHSVAKFMMCRLVIFALLVLGAFVLHADSRSWMKGPLHPLYTSMYLFLEEIDPQVYYQARSASPTMRPACRLHSLASALQMGTSHEDNNLHDAFRYVALAHRMDNSVRACV